jgi:hypothetical protein
MADTGCRIVPRGDAATRIRMRPLSETANSCRAFLKQIDILHERSVLAL